MTGQGKSTLCDDRSRLEYPVYDAGGVEVFDATQHLVEEVGHSLVVEVHLDHLTQVRIHQLHHQVPAQHTITNDNHIAS